ncbi:hypothetical protein Tco_0595525 [Tanacetum coccineum]
MTDKYCPRNEMKKLEAELWNLKVIGGGLKLKVCRGIADMIHGNTSWLFKAKDNAEAIEMATELMDKRVSTIAERQAENKRKLENTSRNNQNQLIFERIEKTKRSKNDQKPTRNGKKTKSQEQDKEISQKSQPDGPTQSTQSKID